MPFCFLLQSSPLHAESTVSTQGCVLGTHDQVGHDMPLHQHQSQHSSVTMPSSSCLYPAATLPPGPSAGVLGSALGCGGLLSPTCLALICASALLLSRILGLGCSVCSQQDHVSQTSRQGWEKPDGLFALVAGNTMGVSIKLSSPSSCGQGNSGKWVRLVESLFR